jgi:hypothetical protein
MRTLARYGGGHELGDRRMDDDRRRRSPGGGVAAAVVGDERVDGGGEAVDCGDEAREALAPHLRALLLQPQPPLLQLQDLPVPPLPLLLARHQGARQHRRAAHHARAQAVQTPPLRLRLLALLLLRPVLILAGLRRPRQLLS